MWFKRKKKPEPAVAPKSSDEAGATRVLREQALMIELGLAPTPQRPDVWGVLMETGYPEAVVTLVVMAEGSVSLYFSTGGGTIGAGPHESVRAAAETLLDEVQAHHAMFTPAAATPPPALGRVRFYVRTFGGTLTAEADEQDLGYERHPLAPVFHAGHAVIAAIHELSERP
jgi:hypothetical protein